MTESLLRPTMELRRLNREVRDGAGCSMMHRETVLQQKWEVREGDLLKVEWRDVPYVNEEEVER